ncbi:MAG: type I-U CRISPR-associated helicase/endonuclease Cas3, partial [Thermoplasmata archaeon]
MQLKVEIDTVNLSKFKEQFKELTGNQPFNWQEELYNRFINGSFPEECVVPTGLGKTSVIAIWLLALGNSLSNGEKPRKIPLRLVYVVDRRVIVDQSTDEAMNYINKLSDIEKQPNNHPLSPIAKAFRDLAFLKEGPVVVISTLRGQLAENREWCIDPSRPAIIIGTVDMIGSRLLFSGYGGLGRSHLSLQAGLLATDSLLLIDEAHLSPAFVNTIRQMHRFTKDSKIKPSLNIMFLSATIPSKNEGLQENSKSKFEIDIEKECCNVEAKNRLLAKKIIEFEYFNQLQSEGKKPTDKEIEEELAKTIVKKAVEYKDNKVSVIIFVSTVSLVNMVGDKLIKELGEGDESRI